MNRRRPFFFAVSIAAVVLTFAPIALAGKGGHGGGAGDTGSTGGYTLTLSPGGPYVFGESVYAATNVPVTLAPFIWMKCLPERCGRRHVRPRRLSRRLVLRLGVRPRT